MAEVQDKQSPWTPKTIAGTVLGVLALILVVLNFTSVEINLIVASVEMPVSIMMAIMFLIGYATAKLMGMRKKDG